MNKLPMIINFYLIKGFLKKFFHVFASISLLIFVINLFDVMNKVKDAQNITTIQMILMAFLQVPAFISDISIFIIMLGAMMTLSGLSAKSEITVMRSAGLSIWKIISPIIVTSFILGLISILIFSPLTISADKKYSAMSRELIKKEQKDSFSPKNGIWLKQANMDKKGQEIKIRANKIYRNNLQLEGVTVWFFDEKNKYYRKIDAKNMFLVDDKWQLKSAIINDGENLNTVAKEFEISTNLEPEFIVQKIINNFENVKLFSIVSLPKLINNLESSGFSSRKFKVYFHTLLNQPLLFICMVLIAAYFSINSIRNRNNIVYILAGIIFGLITYISLNIINALGSSGIIPLFMATWLVTILFLAVSTLLVFRKESLD
jgi:lipopolysaccharide export system permease protein